VSHGHDRSFPDFFGIIAEEIHQWPQCPAIFNATDRPRRVGSNIDDWIAKRAHEGIERALLLDESESKGCYAAEVRIRCTQPIHELGTNRFSPLRSDEADRDFADTGIVRRQPGQQLLNVSSTEAVIVEIISG